MAMERNMVSSLITHERIVTTVTKAKAIRPAAEKLISLARQNTLHRFRQALSFLGNDKRVARKLFSKIGPRFENRPGGYTRILKLSRSRLGDNAPLAIFELVERSPEEELQEERETFEQEMEKRRQLAVRKKQRKKRGRNPANCYSDKARARARRSVHQQQGSQED
jgi:large subunit ribosomal protein L17